MEIYVQNESKKGFPVYNETVRATAENWAKGWHGNTKYHVIKTTSDTFTGARITEIDWRDSNGGNAWKMEIDCEIYTTKTTGKYETVIFDLREDKLLEILQNSSVVKGVIQCPLVVVARGAFAMEGGGFHKDFIKSQEVKTLKKIPISQLQIGVSYSTGSVKSEPLLYLGKMETQNYWGEERKGHVFAAMRSYEDSDSRHLDQIQVLVSPGMKVKHMEEDVNQWIEDTISYHTKELNKVDCWSKSYCQKRLNNILDIKGKLNQC